jgi:acyl-coenzyme A synthetase/AMP-(fatty) acid ligase
VVAAEEAFDTGAALELVASRVAAHERVRALELVEEIPRSPSGKLLRRELRDRAT